MLAKRLRSLAKHASFENLTAGMNSSAAQILARPPPAIGALDLPPKSFWLHKQNIKNGNNVLIQKLLGEDASCRYFSAC